MRLETLLSLVAVGTFLVWTYWRDQRRQRQWRSNLLVCDGVPMEDCRVKQGFDGYPLLSGRFAGRDAEVRVLRDDAGLRKLPSLWISVSVRESLPGWPNVDIVARFRVSEYFVPALDLPHRLEAPLTWPEELHVKCSEPSVPLEPLTAEVVDFFTDPRAKEMLVTPLGVRVTYQLAQARRAEYLVLRAGEFDIETCPPDLLRMLLARAHGIARHAALHGKIPHDA